MKIDLSKCEQNQLKAIAFSENKNLIISASAGTGKTTTLINRIMYLLDTNCELNEIMAVTFTELAASQIKEKLQAKLNEQLVFAKEKSQVDFLHKQLEMISNCDISTLHGFCSKTIKKYFYMVDIDSNFKMLSGGEIDYFKSVALDKTFDAFANQKDEQFESLCDAFSRNRNQNEFKKTIQRIEEFLINKYDYKSWSDNKLKTCYNSFGQTNPFMTYLCDYLNEFFEYWKGIFADFTKYLLELNCENYSKISTEFCNLCNQILVCDVRKKVLLCDEFKAVPKINSSKESKENAIINDAKCDLQKTRALFTKSLKNLSEKLNLQILDNFDDDLKQNHSYLNKLLEIVYDYQQNYYSIKQEKNCLDFSDLEYHMLKLLQNDEVRQFIKNSFKHIFVDEYQDINNIQEQIIETISNNNLFLVGDVKQSIYGFRHSNPNIFLQKYYDYQKDNGGKAINLNKNFRSGENVLSFCNFVFDKIMNINTCKVDYKNDARFVFGKTDIMGDKSMTDVQMFVLQKEKQENNEEEKKVYDIFTANKEEDENKDLIYQLQVVVDYIQNVLETEIFDDDLKTYRKVEYKDIAVLIRHRKNAIKTISEYFKKLKIPYCATYEFQLYKTYEVQLILSFLKLILNRHLDIELATVLVSCVCEMSDQDLLTISSSFDKMDFWQKCQEYSKSFDDQISNKLKKLFSELDYFATLSSTCSIKDLCQKIINFYSIENYLCSLPNASTALNNLSLFIDSILEESITESLSSYINYLDNFAADKTFEVNECSSDNGVNINTIHSSKGLEYGVVILLDCGKEYSQQSLKQPVLTSEQFAFAIKNFDFENRTVEDSLAKVVSKLEISQKSKIEEIRLLYVALSRAKQKLAVVGLLSLDDVVPLQSDYAIKNCDNYLSLILGCLSKNQIDKLKENKFLSVEMENHSKFDINYLTAKDIKIDEVSSIKNAEIDQNFYDLLSKQFDYKYPYADSVYLSIKNSVTSISKQEDESIIYNITDFKKKSIQSEDYAIIGTIYHKIMQQIDFSNLQSIEQIKTQIDNIFLANAFDSKYRIQIEDKKIETCINMVKDYYNANQIFKEQKFMLNVPYCDVIDSKLNDKILIQGIIDFASFDGQTLTIIDFKTTKGSEEFLIKKYKLQLQIYAKAMSKFLSPKYVKTLIYSFEKQKIIEVK